MGGIQEHLKAPKTLFLAQISLIMEIGWMLAMLVSPLELSAAEHRSISCEQSLRGTSEEVDSKIQEELWQLMQPDSTVPASVTEQIINRQLLKQKFLELKDRVGLIKTQQLFTLAQDSKGIFHQSDDNQSRREKKVNSNSGRVVTIGLKWQDLSRPNNQQPFALDLRMINHPFEWVGLNSFSLAARPAGLNILSQPFDSSKPPLRVVNPRNPGRSAEDLVAHQYSQDSQRLLIVFDLLPFAIADLEHHQTLFIGDGSKSSFTKESEHYQKRVLGGQWSPDETTVMTYNDAAVFLWDARTGELIRSLDLSSGWRDFSWWGASIIKVAFVEQGQALAFFVKTLRGGLQLIKRDLFNRELYRMSLSSHQTQWSYLTFSRSGQLAAAYSPSLETSFVWNLETGQTLATIPLMLRKEENYWGSQVSLVFSPNGELLLLLGANERIYPLAVKSKHLGEALSYRLEPRQTPVFSAHGDYFAFIEREKEMPLFIDSQTYFQIPLKYEGLPPDIAHRPVKSLGISQDDQIFLIVTEAPFGYRIDRFKLQKDLATIEAESF